MNNVLLIHFFLRYFFSEILWHTDSYLTANHCVLATVVGKLWSLLISSSQSCTFMRTELQLDGWLITLQDKRLWGRSQDVEDKWCFLVGFTSFDILGMDRAVLEPLFSRQTKLGRGVGNAFRGKPVCARVVNFSTGLCSYILQCLLWRH